MKRILSMVVVVVVLGASVVLAQTAGNVIDAEPVLSIPREVSTFQNLIRNGSFESALNGTSPDGWSISQGVTLIDLDDTDRKAGHFSLLLKGPAILTQSIDALEELQGTKVVFGAWVKATQAGEVSLILDDGKSVQSVVNTLAGEWEFLTKKVSVSGQATKVNMAVNISLAHDVLIDGVVLSQLTKSVVFTPNPSDDIKMPSGLIYTDLETGKVGIGTSTPQKELDVAGDIRASGKVYQGELEQQEEVLTKTAADDLYLNNDRDEMIQGSLTSLGDFILGSNQKIYSPGRINIHGEEYLYILNKNGVIISNAWGGNGRLGVEGDLAVGLNAYVNGNVGIGTTAPESLLHLYSSTQDPQVTFERLIGGEKIKGGIYLDNTNNGSLRFDLNQPSGAAGNIILTSYAGGNVGIGTTSPAYKLDVSGNVNATNLCIQGTCQSSWPTGGGSSQWTTSGSDIYYSTGKVGIGVSSPTQELEVAGDIKLSGRILSDGEICIGKCN